MLEWLVKKLLPSPKSGPLGERGEEEAARFLETLGYTIVARGYRNSVGEIDIIARDGGVLVFVEVKTREYDEPTPEEQVNRNKQRKLSQVARIYLGRFKEQPMARFDVVAIVWRKGGTPVIRHIIDAFEDVG